MLNHQAIAISSPTEFSPEAAAEREIFQRQSIQSMLVVPMTHSDKVVGSLGVEVVRGSKTWTQDDINLLKLVGELIAIGWARHKAEEALLAQDSQSKDTQTSTSGGDEAILTADDLAVMPAAWVAELHQAAIEVDSDRIVQLIEQIPDCHVALIEGLTHWVHNFCFDEIIELIESIN